MIKLNTCIYSLNIDICLNTMNAVYFNGVWLKTFEFVYLYFKLIKSSGRRLLVARLSYAHCAYFNNFQTFNTFLYFVCDFVDNDLKVLQRWFILAFSYCYIIAPIYFGRKILGCVAAGSWQHWFLLVTSCCHYFYRKFYLIQNHLVSRILENYDKMICNLYWAQR